MQIYWNKRKRLHKKRVQLPQDWFGTPTWPPFYCFGTPIWPPWRHVKTSGNKDLRSHLGTRTRNLPSWRPHTLTDCFNPCFKCLEQGGLAARSGTEFTWSLQLRKLAELDWAPFSFKTNMAENAEGRWVFPRFWVFRVQIKKRFSRTFLMEFLDIRRRDVWTVHGWLHLSWFGISASSVSLVSVSYIFPPTVVLRTLFLILNICYELPILVWVLQ